ncbi:MAG: hypothetical protein M1814_001975 [Vezdaea aestivalis]|nr:MAG: hypothetical protein M1814_001975 [Vezdaea aestivalis]
MPKPNLIETTYHDWLNEDIRISGSDYADFNGQISKSYVHYDNFLLLPATLLSHPLLSPACKRCSKDEQERFWIRVSKAFGVSHIAINAPIPSMARASCPNILRSPSKLVAVHGVFEDLSLLGVPNVDRNDKGGTPALIAFDKVFWTSCKQNLITQIWAPSRTMFSQGNVIEKRRLLDLLKEDEETATIIPSLSSAVDLYAGIGYFAFCYAKAGFRTVLCWELNEWSVEGMRRGSIPNRFSFSTGPDSAELPDRLDRPIGELLSFHEDNNFAIERIRALAGKVMPIRHVNCGLLPSSQDSWNTALQVLDHKLEGWIHVHDNVDIRIGSDSSAKYAEQERCIAEKGLLILGKLRTLEATYLGRSVMLGRTFKVKSFGPRVVHVVFDFKVDGQIVS